jgi:DNA-binding CsgD family transcriptional regulator
MANRPAPALLLSDQQVDVLTTWSRSRALSQRQVLRARIVLLAAEGAPTSSIAARLGCSQPTVRLWRERFALAGIAGLEQDAPGRGRRATYDERTVAQVISITLGRPPRGETHWSSRAFAERVGVSKTTVVRIWRDHELQPHRTRSFKFSTDPELEAKVIDVIGLYLHPPERAVAVLCVDEKSQIQALDRT